MVRILLDTFLMIYGAYLMSGTFGWEATCGLAIFMFGLKNPPEEDENG